MGTEEGLDEKASHKAEVKRVGQVSTFTSQTFCLLSFDFCSRLPLDKLGALGFALGFAVSWKSAVFGLDRLKPACRLCRKRQAEACPTISLPRGDYSGMSSRKAKVKRVGQVSSFTGQSFCLMIFDFCFRL
jgi:hypothetical protein